MNKNLFLSVLLIIAIFSLSIFGLEFNLKSNPDTTGYLTYLSGNNTIVQPLMNGEIHLFTLSSQSPVKVIKGKGPYSGAAIIVYNNYLVIPTLGKKLLKIDITQDKESWSFDLGSPIKTSPLFLETSTPIIVVTTLTGTCFGIDFASGKKLWSHKEDSLIMSSPTLWKQGSDFFAVFGTTGGKVVVIDNGGKVFKSFELGDSVSTSPAVGLINDDPVQDILIVTDSGKVQAINGSSFELLWSRELNSRVKASPLLGHFNSDNKPDPLIVTSSGKVIALSSTGETLWENDLKQPVSNTPGLFYGGNKLCILIATDKGDVLILSGTNGGLLNKHSLNSKIKVSPIIGDFDGNSMVDVYIATRKKKGYVLDTEMRIEDQTEFWSGFQRDYTHSGLISYRDFPESSVASSDDWDPTDEDPEIYVQPKPTPKPKPKPKPKPTSTVNKEYKNLIIKGETLLESGEFDKAIAAFSKAKRLKNTKEVTALIKKAKEQKAQSEVLPDF